MGNIRFAVDTELDEPGNIICGVVMKMCSHGEASSRVL